mmetsp:Transcript_97711/g.232631  ORF Transcript_97711/g.232631 Transcript_97711/m.232631 type:complete len:202 (+) Transcript_97711:627-1232(+)
MEERLEACDHGHAHQGERVDFHHFLQKGTVVLQDVLAEREEGLQKLHHAGGILRFHAVLLEAGAQLLVKKVPAPCQLRQELQECLAHGEILHGPVLEVVVEADRLAVNGAPGLHCSLEPGRVSRQLLHLPFRHKEAAANDHEVQHEGDEEVYMRILHHMMVLRSAVWQGQVQSPVEVLEASVKQVTPLTDPHEECQDPQHS